MGFNDHPCEASLVILAEARPRSCMEDAEHDLEFLVSASRGKKQHTVSKKAL